LKKIKKLHLTKAAPSICPKRANVGAAKRSMQLKKNQTQYKKNIIHNLNFKT